MSSPLTQRDEVPERSVDQRLQALALANNVRKQTALLKVDLKCGRASITTLIADPPQYLASAKMVQLLRALPGYGPVKVAHLLECCRVSPRRTVKGLNERQRRELIKALEE